MRAILCFILLATVATTVYSLDCCTYFNVDTNTCDDVNCPSTCVWMYDECPYYSGCMVVLRQQKDACMEPDQCVCNPYGPMLAAPNGPGAKPTTKPPPPPPPKHHGHAIGKGYNATSWPQIKVRHNGTI